VSTQTTPAVRISLEDYIPLLGKSEIDELMALGRPLRGRGVTMVNSTAVGGGVAEILNRLIPLAADAGVEIEWQVMQGAEEFYQVTKAFHNALHGGPYQLNVRDFEIFLEFNQLNRERLNLDHEFVVIHDPQPAAMLIPRKNNGSHWVWRCHIDLSRPNEHVWDFLQGFVSKYDVAIFSSPEFSRQLPIPQYLFYPAIDPLSAKCRTLDPALVESILEQFQIDSRRPILTQISRFDRLKDPIGVIRAYRSVKRYFDCQLVLAGGGATDDPEGSLVLQEVRHEAESDPDIHVLELPAQSPTEINALQTASTIIIQKSLREGFGLTVAEGLWKGKPVVASAVGGIPLQVIHKHTGLLAHSVEGTAYQIRYLLSHPEIAAKLGENGHRHVKENFLITSNLRRYFTLFLMLSK
jgi:trehalose synthase